ncbi:DUF397 domain-containing protein [Streptomyces sp. C10-9-1]|uniref:DUF397 domain-containing protein n=1 Tax=Streptomyces sp. C10-9-1 TaxID=1859285 RepID=UPI002112A4F0|nr:DUF397 domain-containing protein [Streptomyces sp. C10-9-1]MCQ6554730.1 DUF397 domain-containing protein [Streptomyces sp. C10-9-1]
MTISDSSATGYEWTKSSFSGGNNNCVEVAAGAVPGAMPVRDSKAPAGPAIVVGADAWSTFVDGLKR